MSTAHLGLGSDVGDRVAWLRRGVVLLHEAGLEVAAVSSLYLTEPVGDPTLPWFLNCALELRNPPQPERLLELCLRVEAACGRERSPAADAGAGAEPRPDVGRGAPAQASTGPPDAAAERSRRQPPQPRTLDIDVLLHGSDRITAPGLEIPHPRLHRRRFALRPLAEIAPDAVHPLQKRTVREMLEELEATESVWLLAPFR